MTEQPCPEESNGLVWALTTEDATLVLICDECGTVWESPADLGTGNRQQPAHPDWGVSGGRHVRPGTTRWANAQEVAAIGWSTSFARP